MPSEGSGLEWGILSKGNLVVFFPKKGRGWDYGKCGVS